MTAPGAAASAVPAAGPAWDALARVSERWHRRTGVDGVTRCDTHRVEHTARTATSIVLDLALQRATGEDEYGQRAQHRAAHVVERLVRDPEHGGWIFGPGRLDPYNCSNNVIDSGECARSLGTLLLVAGERLDESLRGRIEEALRLNATSYLCETAATKECTNQRLWGAMGLATAARALGEPGWFDCVRQGTEQALREQHPDGSFPYHPQAAAYGLPPGAADVSVYYQSRVLTYLLHALEMMGERTAPLSEPYAGALRRGLAFLAATYTPLGYKCAALEGKRWFWAGPYEVGSHATDVYALSRGAALFQDDSLARLASLALTRWIDHVQPNGDLVACADRAGRDDFICADFHAADSSWMAAALGGDHRLTPRPPLHPSVEGWRGGVRRRQDGGADGGEGWRRRPHHPPTVTTFPDAGLVRVEHDRGVVLLRTAKQPANVLYGGGVGGGSLLYAGAAESDWHDLVQPDRERPRSPGNLTCWPAQRSRRAALWAFLRANRPGRELRQVLFVARMRLRAKLASGGPLRALWRGWVRPLAEALDGATATHWGLGAAVAILPDGLLIITQPARLDGAPLPGVTLKRRLAWGQETVRVRETVSVRVPLRRLVYTVPVAARQLRIRPAGWLVCLRSSQGNEGQTLDIRGAARRGPMTLGIEYVL